MNKDDIGHKLERLADAIERIAKPIPAIPAIPQIPAIPPLQNYTADHDLLTKLDTKVDQIQLDVSELKKDKNVYITQTEHQEVVKVCTDHEIRLRSTETTQTRIISIGGVIIFLTTVLQIVLRFFGV